MQGVTDEEKSPYRNEPGTVIAVRTNLYQTGKYRGFREIIDQYVLYPEVPIHFESAEEGCYDYPTEKELMDGIHGLKTAEGTDGNGGFEFLLSDEDMKNLEKEVPGLICKQRPGVVIRCVPLDDYMQSPYLTGATLYAETIGEFEPLEVTFGKIHTNLEVAMDFSLAYNRITCEISFYFPTLPMQLYQYLNEIVEKYFPGMSFEKWRFANGFYDGTMNENMDPNDRLVLETYDKWMKFQKEYGIVKMQRVKQMITDSADPVSRGLSSCWEGGGNHFFS